MTKNANSLVHHVNLLGQPLLNLAHIRPEHILRHIASREPNRLLLHINELRRQNHGALMLPQLPPRARVPWYAEYRFTWWALYKTERQETKLVITGSNHKLWHQTDKLHSNDKRHRYVTMTDPNWQSHEYIVINWINCSKCSSKYVRSLSGSSKPLLYSRNLFDILFRTSRSTLGTLGTTWAGDWCRMLWASWTLVAIWRCFLKLFNILKCYFKYLKSIPTIPHRGEQHDNEWQAYLEHEQLPIGPFTRFTVDHVSFFS